MAVITISREYASRGDDIARQVAHALGYHLVDKEFIAALLSQYGIVEFDRGYEALPGFWERFSARRLQDRETAVDMLNRVVRGVAHHGNVVIVGRSGFAILKGLSDVLHVRIQAPLSVRAVRAATERGLTPQQAEALVREQDKVRATFVEEFYAVPWDTSTLFDLVINTGKVAPETAVRWIVEAAQALAAGPAAGPTGSSLTVDGVLAAAIANTLACPTAQH